MAYPKHIGVLTGGGDCPGLNAVIRAVLRGGGLGARSGYRFLGCVGGGCGHVGPFLDVALVFVVPVGSAEQFEELFSNLGVTGDWLVELVELRLL